MISGERDALLLLSYVMFSSGAVAKAEKVLAGLVKVYPDDPEIGRLLCAARLRQGKFKEVIDATAAQLEAGGTADAARAALQWMRAEALWALGRQDEARDYINGFVEWRARTEELEAALDPL